MEGFYTPWFTKRTANSCLPSPHPIGPPSCHSAGPPDLHSAGPLPLRPAKPLLLSPTRHPLHGQGGSPICWATSWRHVGPPLCKPTELLLHWVNAKQAPTPQAHQASTPQACQKVAPQGPSTTGPPDHHSAGLCPAGPLGPHYAGHLSTALPGLCPKACQAPAPPCCSPIGPPDHCPTKLPFYRPARPLHAHQPPQEYSKPA
jgi:hypothetical protein